MLYRRAWLQLTSSSKNGTLAELVPVTVNTWPVTYVYTASGLILAYGVAFLCALSCSAVGLYAFYVNNASYQNIFSTYIRATVDSAIRSQTQSGDNGEDPLPKTLATFYVAFGRHREEIEEIDKRDEHEDVELRRLNVAQINPSLDLSWNTLDDVHGFGGPRDHHTGSLGDEERSLQTEVETRSVVSSIKEASQDSQDVRAENMEGDVHGRSD